MKLSVYVLGRAVAVFEQVGDFKSVLTYHAGVAADDFVSLTMPVRTHSYEWDDPLHPVLRMNLPEGYLLQVLQEQFGPHVGASPTALLAVIGRNMVGRLQVAAPGASLDEPANPIEVKALLRGDNSEAAFAALVRAHAASGVAGVAPKFLDAQNERLTLGPHKKVTLLTRRHIIKGSSRELPYVALNEYLCMKVAARVMPTAKAQVSRDGKALVIDRFDTDARGQRHMGMEDFCALLGLRPAAKYDTTWERIAKAVHDHVPGAQRQDALRGLAMTLLLTYALRNADCHAKNLALIYTSRNDVRLSPAYDMVTTSVYAGYQHNPPAIAVMGKKTWAPGKTLQRFIIATLGVSVKSQMKMIEAIGDAASATASDVRVAMKERPGFADIGKRMLMAWHEGISGLRNERTYAMGEWRPAKAMSGFSEPARLKSPKRAVAGRSELLAKR